MAASNIKWRPQDISAITKGVRKFNAAITRMEKMYPELLDSGVLPSRLDTTELKQRILTRKDFNREIKRIDRFFKKGARDIVTTPEGYKQTRWQRNEMRYLEQSLNTRRKAYVEKYNVPKDQRAFLNLEPVNIKKEFNKYQKEIGDTSDTEDRVNLAQAWYNFLYTSEREQSEKYYESNFYRLRNAYFKAAREHLREEDAEKLIQYLLENNVWGSDIVYAISINDALGFEYIYSLDEKIDKYEHLVERWERMLPKLKPKG